MLRYQCRALNARSPLQNLPIHVCPGRNGSRPAGKKKTGNRPEDSRLVIQAGGCRLSVGGDVSETMLRSILKAVSADA
jgi:hypothetical protein